MDQPFLMEAFGRLRKDMTWRDNQCISNFRRGSFFRVISVLNNRCVLPARATFSCSMQFC